MEYYYTQRRLPLCAIRLFDFSAKTTRPRTSYKGVTTPVKPHSNQTRAHKRCWHRFIQDLYFWHRFIRDLYFYTFIEKRSMYHISSICIDFFSHKYLFHLQYRVVHLSCKLFSIRIAQSLAVAASAM